MNLRKYGITPEQYDQMWQEQDGLCACCGMPEVGRNQFGVLRLAVDHNHETGVIRGLLCMRCNRALGLLGDDPAIVEQLLRYRVDADDRAVGRTRAFVSGPMGGIEHHNYPAFNAAAAALRSLGWAVENPAECSLRPGSAYADYLRHGLTKLIKCTAIFLLPGWQNSPGALIELNAASLMGMETWLYHGPDQQELVTDLEVPPPLPIPVAAG